MSIMGGGGRASGSISDLSNLLKIIADPAEAQRKLDSINEAQKLHDAKFSEATLAQKEAAEAQERSERMLQNHTETMAKERRDLSVREEALDKLEKKLRDGKERFDQEVKSRNNELESKALSFEGQVSKHETSVKAFKDSVALDRQKLNELDKILKERSKVLDTRENHLNELESDIIQHQEYSNHDLLKKQEEISSAKDELDKKLSALKAIIS